MEKKEKRRKKDKKKKKERGAGEPPKIRTSKPWTSRKRDKNGIF